MQSNAMATYCEAMLAKLWDPAESERLLLDATEVVARAADNNFQRDNIRTEPFTKRVKAAVR
jgi:hypothetical protein